MLKLSTIINLLQGCSDAENIAADNNQLEPYILATENEYHLITDGQVITSMSRADVPLLIMSAFFVYNICYPVGLGNLYAVLELVVLGFDTKAARANASVQHFMSMLK